MLNLEDEQYIRCVNCWQLHTHNKSILDHWNNGACMFYCTICGKSFHDNIKNLKPHFENDHSIKYQQMFLQPLRQTKTTETAKNVDVVAKKVEPVKKTEQMKKPCVDDNKKALDLQPNPLNLGEYHCEPCNRTFKHRQAYRTHYTLVHKKKHWQIVSQTQTNGVDEKTIKPIALVNDTKKSSNIQKNKKWKKRPYEAVMKTIVRNPAKRPIISLNNPPPLQPARKLAAQIVSLPSEMLAQANTTTSIANIQNSHELQVSQDQTVSTTFLPTSIAGRRDDIQIKLEPELDPELDPNEEFPNGYVDVPVPAYNSWVHLPPHYDGFNQNVDSYIDTSPRLKVKDLTDLQDPKQRRHPIETETQVYQQNIVYKEPPMIMPNQNMSGLQIQNVQSYQPHSVQPQSYVDYPYLNSMSSSMNITDHGMCTSNPYEMHISQAQQVQNTQFINPVFLLPSNSTVQDYRY